MAQFSKTALIQAIMIRRMNLETEYRRVARKHLDPENGTAQLPPGNMDAAVVFGEWRALRDLADSVAAGEVRA